MPDNCTNDMFFVYVIKSLSRNYVYTGLTNNFSRRLNDHNCGYNKTTKAYKPFELLILENFSSRPEARSREKNL